MSKATKTKTMKLKPFQKLLTLMISGKPVTIEEIDTLLGKEIYMYRLSTYIWHIKTVANGVVKAIKTGRKVTAYQVMNVDQVKEYMSRVGVTGSGFAPGAIVKKQSISKLADLNSKPVNQVIADQPVAQAA
tara:strand:- start:193 stop:585 length:393 start_codon:yes stop_codon:yes gene_type:complete